MGIVKDQLFQAGGCLCRFHVRLLLRKENQKVGEEELCYSFSILRSLPPPQAKCLARFSWGCRVGHSMVLSKGGSCYLFFILIISQYV